MAEPYLTELIALTNKVFCDDESRNSVSVKHFFSGAAAYREGAVFMTLTPVGLALKLPEATCTQLVEHGATPLQYFPNAPIKKGYAVLSDQMTAEDTALFELIRSSAKFVR